MICERYQAAIGAWVDGTLDRVERRELEDHLAGCRTCASLAADLQRLRHLARGLERLSPPPALWDRVAARTERAPAPPRLGVAWMGLAAAAVLLIAAGLLTFGRSGDGPPAVAEAPEPSSIELVQTVEAELRLAEQHYENAIVALEKLARDQQMLDPGVAATLHRNLQVIDGAISESREALRTQPGSHVAQQSLFQAFRSKIALLEDTIALLSELRQQSQATIGPGTSTDTTS